MHREGFFSTPFTSSCHCKQTAYYLLWAESSPDVFLQSLRRQLVLVPLERREGEGEESGKVEGEEKCLAAGCAGGWAKPGRITFLVHHAGTPKKDCHPSAVALFPEQHLSLHISSRRSPVGYVPPTQGAAGPGSCPIFLL